MFRQFTVGQMGWLGLCIFYEAFYGRCRCIYVCVLPSGVLRNEYLAMIYCFSDLIVECFCLMYVGGLEFFSFRKFCILILYGWIILYFIHMHFVL